MSSNALTIKNAKTARHLKRQGVDIDQIAKKLDVSGSRVREYLERNTHPKNCSTCEGFGINKQRSTGVRTPICDCN